MDCACVMIEDSKQPEFFKSKIVTAKNPHICSECHREIQPGEKYEYVSGKWEGCFDTFKTCEDCLSIRSSFFCEGYMFGGMFEMLSEHIDEMDGEISSDCIVDLTPAARAKVCEMIEREWEYFDDDED